MNSPQDEIIYSDSAEHFLEREERLATLTREINELDDDGRKMIISDDAEHTKNLSQFNQIKSVMQKSQDRRTDFEVHQLTNLLKN